MNVDEKKISSETSTEIRARNVRYLYVGFFVADKTTPWLEPAILCIFWENLFQRINSSLSFPNKKHFRSCVRIAVGKIGQIHEKLGQF